MKGFLLSAMVLAAAVGCNKTQVTSGDVSGTEIRLGSEMEATIASKTAYSGDVAISGLQFMRLDLASPVAPAPVDFTGSVPFSGNRAVLGAVTFDAPQMYSGTKNTYIASFFPSGALASNTITWSIDGKTDVMTAATVDVGTVTAALSPALSYKHQLAQVEVICKAESVAKEAAVAARWGNIVSIKVAGTPTTMSYSLSNLQVTNGATAGVVALVKSGYSETFTPIAIPPFANTDANAVGMIAPMATRTFTLEVTTEKEGVKTVTVDLGANKQVERAKKHVITLTFYDTPIGTPIVVTATNIEEWTEGNSGSASVI